MPGATQAPAIAVAQAKMPRTARPVYRPQLAPRVLQAKALIQQPRLNAQSAAVQRKTSSTAIQRSCFAGLCSWVGSLFGANNNANYAELDDLSGSQLTPWGAATFLGYHKTAHWADIKRTGEFRPGGGMLGDGIYICKSDYAWVTAMYPTLDVLLEVGYVGDMSGWTTVELSGVMEYKRRDDIEGNYDVVKTKNDTGPNNQICYKMDGPGHIIPANFRVRKVRT